jgi:aminoglycoside phosphotransferase (APT) family kinase protein
MNAVASGRAPDRAEPTDTALLDAMRRMGIVGANQQMRLTPLAGGVSSDIYRADLPSRVICVKRALGKLKVAADWRAPVGRSRYEVEWMRVAGATAPAAVPEILGEDRESGTFAMAFLAPDTHPLWKSQLRDGMIDRSMAVAVGDVLGRIHGATADRRDVAERFPTDDIFYAIRLEPYLAATARAQPHLAARLNALLETTRTTKRVLVHGDFSPKNLLAGPAGPVILDAECAWYGDPAFDLAFVLNHLLLKGAWRPQWRARYASAGDALVNAYFAHAHWEPRSALAARTAALLPALMLARIDGKSPVEYLTDEAVRDDVRSFAGALVAAPVADPRAIADRWVARSAA